MIKEEQAWVISPGAPDNQGTPEQHCACRGKSLLKDERKVPTGRKENIYDSKTLLPS